MSAHMQDKSVAEAADAIEEVYYCFHNYVDSGADEGVRAQRLVALYNAVSDLASWHPGWDYETGTMPYEREDEE